MAEVKAEQEPSIEEILESIRQIISEDSDTEQKPEPAVDLSVAPPAAVKPAAPPPPPKPVVDKPVPLDLTEKVSAPDKGVPLDLTPPAPPSIEIDMMDSPMTNDLMSSQTADVATDALSKILAANVAVEREGTSPAGKVTLEEIARDLMRPIIKIWIDQNLPGIVEKAVQKEVEKLSRRAADR